MSEEHQPSEPTQQIKAKWYFNNIVVLLTFLLVGPFVLPLVWLNPKYSSSNKVLFTVIILVLSSIILKLMVTHYQ